MESEDTGGKKYYKWSFFYFDQTSKKILVWEPDNGRFVFNFANKRTYLTVGIMNAVFITAMILKILNVR